MRKFTCICTNSSLFTCICTKITGPEFVDSKSENFDPKTRKRLFDLFLSCCDDSGSTSSQDGLSDYRREVERYKSSHHTRSKDSMDRVLFDKELSE